MDLSKIREAMAGESLTFCPKCQFPLVQIAGKYQLKKVLRKGGCSIVYLARHIHLDHDNERVIKIIRPEFFTIKGMATRFRREVQVTSVLSQRNEHIVRIFDDFGQIPNIGHFYVMEYLQGAPLSSMLKDPALLPSLSFCFHLFLQLCETMQFAHEMGVVHRDLKPDNLMLVKRKRDPYFLKVLDFGIAKPMSTEELPATQVTQGSLGTPAYMAPEQCLNQPTDARTDLYAMGIILYELLTGRTPFLPPQGEHSAYTSVVGVIEGQITTPPPSPHELRPDRVTTGLEKIILQALAKKPEQRFPSVEEFRAAFLNEVSHMPAFTQEEEALSTRQGPALSPYIGDPTPPSGALLTSELEKAFMGVSMSSLPSHGPERESESEEELDHTLMYGLDTEGTDPAESRDATSLKSAPSVSPEVSEQAEPTVAFGVGALGEAAEEEAVLLLNQGDAGPDPLPAPTPQAEPTMAPILLTQPKRTSDYGAFDDEVLLLEQPPPKEPLGRVHVAPDELATKGPGETLLVERYQAKVALIASNQTGAPEEGPTVADVPGIQPEAHGVSVPAHISLGLDDDDLARTITDNQRQDNQHQEEVLVPDDAEPLFAEEAHDEDTEDQIPTQVASTALRIASINEDLKQTIKETDPQPLAPAAVEEEEPPLSLVNRVQGPRDGVVSLFLTQHQEWDADPFLLKSLQKKVKRLRGFVESESFRRLYPGCKAKIIVESRALPREVVKQMLQEKIELRLLPRSASQPPSVVSAPPPTPAPVSQPQPLRQAQPASQPAVAQATKAPVAPSVPPPAPQRSTSPNRGKPSAAQAPALPSQGALRQKSNGANGHTQLSAATTIPTPPTPVIDHVLVPKGPSPMPILNDIDDYEPATLSPHRAFSAGSVFSVLLLLLALAGMAYSLKGMDQAANKQRNRLNTVPVQSVSAKEQPKQSYVQVSLRPDRATFALIPVVDRKTGSTEVFVLFAARENRRLLIYAPQDRSQILQRLIQRPNPNDPSADRIVPVWQPDLRKLNSTPALRTYTGTLERLQRRKHGPLELVLPDENRNVNKIRGFIQAGIRFPMDSMVLLVGQTPKPPSDRHSTLFVLSLIIALAAGGALVSIHRQQQRSF